MGMTHKPLLESIHGVTLSCNPLPLFTLRHTEAVSTVEGVKSGMLE